MANEFVARYGVIAQNNSVISGSLIVTNGFTGSLSGTSSQALTSSYVNPLTQSLSLQGSFTVSGSSGTVLSSNADTLLISGSLIVTGSTSLTGSLNVSSNIYANNLNLASTVITAANATSSLNATSSRAIIVTGSTNQSIQLPDATTLVTGSIFYVNNNTTSGTVLVKNGAGSFFNNVPWGGNTEYILLSNASVGGTWDSHAFLPSGTSWGHDGLSFQGTITATTTATNQAVATFNGYSSAQTADLLDIYTYSGGTKVVYVTASGGLNATAGITGSLLGTASYAAQALSSSYALTASYALNGGGGSTIVTGSNATLNQSSAATTWSFNHNLNTQYPVFQVFDSNNNVIIPQTITALTPSSSVIYFPTAVAGTAIASVGGYTGNATSSSYAATSSYASSFTASNATVTGNLGVGIANPSFPLEVSSTSTTLLGRFTSNQTNAAIRLVNSSAGLGRTYSIGSGNSGSAAINGFYIYDETGGYTAFAISGSGAVSTGNTIKIGSQGGNDTTVITGGSGYGAKVQLNTSTLGTANTVLTGNTDSYINATTGNVGIGTNNPSYQLDVQKGSSPTLRVRNNAAGGTSTLILETANTYSGTSQAYIQCIGTAGDGTSQLAFATGNSAGSVSATEAMRISNGGNLLVGTTTDNGLGRLIVDGVAGIYMNSSGRGNRQIYFGSDGALIFYNTSNYGYLSAAGAWINASDVSIKKDIVDIKYGLADVLNLKPRSYRMKSGNKEEIGFIAQEVESIIPEVVNDAVGDGVKGLNYGNMVSVLVKAIQEQQALIQELTTRLTALENK